MDIMRAGGLIVAGTDTPKELVEGQTLDRGLTSNGLPTNRLLQIAIPLVDAVSAAHQRGVIHRDLKPGNVMV